VRTTLNINDALLKELRQYANSSGKTFRSVVEQALVLGLAQQMRAKPKRKFRVRPHSLQMKPGFRGMSMNQLYDQIESETITRQR
jgi:hypothetical protein